VARLTRQQLKRDRLQTVYEEYEQWAREHYRDVLWAVGAAVLVGGLVIGVKTLDERREEAANAALGAGLDTFHAYVGAAPPGALGSNVPSYPTAEAKYKKALGQFLEAANAKGLDAILPRARAATLALYYAGLCQAQIGNDAGAMKAFEQLARDSHADLAALGRFAQAGELVKTGKRAEGVKIYDELATHPTSTVTRDMALLAKAQALAPTDPAGARAVYAQLQKEFSTDPRLASEINQQAASLSK
jgi:tetratricopeptide (TPR) repeat protein